MAVQGSALPDVHRAAVGPRAGATLAAASSSLITRYLTQGAIALALETVSSRPTDTPAAFRRCACDRFLLIAFAHTGARLNEIVSASMGSIYTEGNGRWWLDVLGKGNKPRRLPVPPEMLDAFQSYRQAFELLPQTSRTDLMPLVLSSRSREPARITDEAAAEAIKAVFADAARAADAQGDQDMAGHENIATTAAYLHWTDNETDNEADNERHDEIIRSVSGKSIL